MIDPKNLENISTQKNETQQFCSQLIHFFHFDGRSGAQKEIFEKIVRCCTKTYNKSVMGAQI